MRQIRGWRHSDKAAERKQPVCEGRPLPYIAPYDLTVHGVAKPGATIRLSPVFETRGQCDTGFFSIRMEVYVQIPDENFYEVIEIGEKLVGSLKPCREKSCNGSRHMTTFEYKLLNKDYVYYEFSAFGDSTWDVEEFNEKNNVWKRKTALTVRRQ